MSEPAADWPGRFITHPGSVALERDCCRGLENISYGIASCILLFIVLLLFPDFLINVLYYCIICEKQL